MSRKPIDQLQPFECRAAIWTAIRRLKTFDLDDLQMVVKLEKNSIQEYVTGLKKAGYLESAAWPTDVPLCQRGKITYTLVNDIGIDAPRVRKDGSRVTQGQSRRQMWNALQVLKRFTPRELAFNAATPDCQVSEQEAKGYVSALHRANYLKLMTPAKSGHKPGTGKQAVYTLIPAMWTGPHPPQIQRTKQVYDPNLRRVVWAKVEGGAE